MNLLSKFLSSNETASSKRLVTLIISAHFIIASFVILFFAFYVIVVEPKGMVKPEILQLLQNVMEYDFYIILGGLGFITVENFGQAIVQKAKVYTAGQILTPQPQTKVENVEGDVNNSTTTDKTTMKGDDILADNDMKEIKKHLTDTLKTPE